MNPIQNRAANNDAKLIILVFFVSLILALLNLLMKLEMTPSWFDGTLELNHSLLLDYNFTNNEQSRLFQFYIPELISATIGLTIPEAYAIQRVLFTSLTFFFFFFYSQKWFNNWQAILLIIVFAAIIPATYRNHLQESAPLMSLTFLICLWAIRDKKDLLFMSFLVLGSVNNETTLFLPAVYFFYHYTTISSFFRVTRKTVLLALPAYVIVGIIRLINIDRPHLGEAWRFTHNMQYLDTVFLVYHAFWVLPFIFFRKKPFFLQRSLLTIPLFIIPHFITGNVAETRQMLPLAFILLPGSLFTVLEIQSRYLRDNKQVTTT